MQKITTQSDFICSYGAQASTILTALAALVFAYFAPDFRPLVCVAALLLVLYALMIQQKGERIGYKPIGYLLTLTFAIAAVLMPDIESLLICLAFVVCLVTTIFL